MKIKISLLLLGLMIFLGSCQESATTKTQETTVTKASMVIFPSKKGSVKVTIMYPKSEGSTFDMDYYSEKHMPMVARLLGESMKGFTIDKGISGRTPEDPIPYWAIGYLHFDKLSDYQESFGPHAEQIVGDIPNYTNVQPLIQISEVVK